MAPFWPIFRLAYTAGAGTTILAAKLEGYPALGIELSAHYAEMSAKRLAEAA